MKKQIILITMLVMMSFFGMSNIAMAQGYTVMKDSTQKEEFNYAVGGGYVSIIDGDYSGTYVSVYSLNEKWMAEIGYCPADGEIAGEDEDSLLFIDASWLYRFEMEDAEPGTSTWVGIGGEWLNGQYGIVGQLGYEQNQWLLRVKFGWLTEDTKPFMVGIGYSF